MTRLIARIDSRTKLRNRPSRILCVDDDPDISRSIQFRLGDYRVVVRRSFFGTQGYSEAVKYSPDLIIMDHAMPNGDGQYLLETLRQNQHTADIPVIVLTGMRDDTLRTRMLAMGANQFLNKPIRFEDLFNVINRLVPLKLRRDETRQDFV